MAGVKSVQDLGNGKVYVTYTDGKSDTLAIDAASKVINQAKLAGHYTPYNSANVPSSNPGGIPAFGVTPGTGSSTNSTSSVASGAVTSDNINSYLQQAYSSKSNGFSKIRKALVDAGIISKGTRSLTSVQNAWTSVLQGAQFDNTDPFTYISNIKKQGVGLDTAPSGLTDYSQVSIWDPTKAKDYISQLTTNLLNRDATDAEIADIQKKLAAAQKKNPSKTTYTKDKSGKTLATTTGGLDEQQFITDLIKKNPEYAKVKEAGTTAALQSVQDAARANGITLSADDAAKYAERVRNGEKVDEIASLFRKIASVSQPQKISDLLNSGVNLADIYSPYKSAMAKTLEIDPNTIDFTDPALSNAITGDKTMTTYEFQRALRKDPRWQYTNNARDEAATAATQILKDFGFMG